jgi:hypothetical protein
MKTVLRYVVCVLVSFLAAPLSAIDLSFLLTHDGAKSYIEECFRLPVPTGEPDIYNRRQQVRYILTAN